MTATFRPVGGSFGHGIGAGGPIETPTLSGQYPQYLEAQLKAFASGQRHNER